MWQVRGLLERHAVTTSENVWNGRPIALIGPCRAARGPLTARRSRSSSLIPPVHQRVYKMGPEHLGVVVGVTPSTRSSTPTSPC